MRASYLIALISIISIVAPQALAGWASGGGKIHRDSLNPWFLENTKVVNYCIEVDEEHFGVSAEEASKVVAEELKDWKSALAALDTVSYPAGYIEPYGDIRVGTQDFVEVNCNNTDASLRFQFGTLTEDQRDLFVDPREYVGIAMRSAYDLKNLRAKGFIYIAPRSGPLKPDLRNMHASPWSVNDGFIFHVVLRHEIGHIFGFGHRPKGVMDAMYPELLVLSDNAGVSLTPSIVNQFSLERFFSLTSSWTTEGCGADNPVFNGDIFALPFNFEACGRVQLSEDGIEIYHAEGTGLPYEKVGDARFESGGTLSETASWVHLTEMQKVFKITPRNGGLDIYPLFGAMDMKISETWSGDLNIIRNGKVHPLRIERDLFNLDSTLGYKNRLLSNWIELR